ncbi:MAG: NUDIX hydrolase [Candidatus Gracilibacteria bacterium]
MRAPHLFGAVYIILLQDKKVLLARRFNTGFEDGKYSLPSGHIEPGESYKDAVIHEAKEELGIEILPEDLEITHLYHNNNKDDKREYMALYFKIKKWKGEPRNAEPEKCDDICWFPLDAIPENTISTVKDVLKNVSSKFCIGEIGYK